MRGRGREAERRRQPPRSSRRLGPGDRSPAGGVVSRGDRPGRDRPCGGGGAGRRGASGAGLAAGRRGRHLFGTVGKDGDVGRLCGGLAGILVVEWGSEPVAPVLARRRDQHGVRQRPDGLDEAIDQGVFPELGVRRRRPPDAGLLEIVEGLEPVAQREGPSFAQRRLVDASQASPDGLLARSDVEDRLAGQPERGQTRLELGDGRPLAVET